MNNAILWVWIVVGLLLFFVSLTVYEYTSRAPAKAAEEAEAEEDAAAAEEPAPEDAWRPVPSIALSRAESDAAKRPTATLSAYYPSSRATVPEDWPRVPIGTCPLSRAQKHALPVSDAPRCFALESESMRLDEPQTPLTART